MKKYILVLLILLLSSGVIMARCHYRDCCDCRDYYECEECCADCDRLGGCECCDRYNHRYRYYTVYYPIRGTNISIRYHNRHSLNHPRGIPPHPHHAAAARIYNTPHHPPRPMHGGMHHHAGMPPGGHPPHPRH